MKLHKRSYKILIFGDPYPTKKTVNGLCSDSFGMHKDINKQFTVSHLKSGYKIMGFTLAVQARDFIDRMEKAVFPVSWDIANVKQLMKNQDKVLELTQLSNKVR